jgi:hypothetical protein
MLHVLLEKLLNLVEDYAENYAQDRLPGATGPD